MFKTACRIRWKARCGRARSRPERRPPASDFRAGAAVGAVADRAGSARRSLGNDMLYDRRARRAKLAGATPEADSAAGVRRARPVPIESDREVLAVDLG